MCTVRPPTCPELPGGPSACHGGGDGKACRGRACPTPQACNPVNTQRRPPPPDQGRRPPNRHSMHNTRQLPPALSARLPGQGLSCLQHAHHHWWLLPRSNMAIMLASNEQLLGRGTRGQLPGRWAALREQKGQWAAMPAGCLLSLRPGAVLSCWADQIKVGRRHRSVTPMPVVPAPTEAPINLHSTGIAFAVSLAASSLVCWAQGRLPGGSTHHGSSVVRTQAAPPALPAATPEDPCRSCKVGVRERKKKMRDLLPHGRQSDLSTCPHTAPPAPATQPPPLPALCLALPACPQGTGRVTCIVCQGRGRTNHPESSILPHGEGPAWCSSGCGGSGLAACGRCLGTGQRPPSVGFRLPNAR
jgi:hypothetical protein